MISLTFPGRPVPWARVKRGKAGNTYTPPKQAKHREDVALMLKVAARKAGIRKFEGPVCLRVRFDYGRNETVIELYPGIRGEHAFEEIVDTDNLAKQIMEAVELSGVVDNDAQVAYLEAEKIG